MTTKLSPPSLPTPRLRRVVLLTEKRLLFLTTTAIFLLCFISARDNVDRGRERCEGEGLIEFVEIGTRGTMKERNASAIFRNVGNLNLSVFVHLSHTLTHTHRVDLRGEHFSSSDSLLFKKGTDFPWSISWGITRSPIVKAGLGLENEDRFIECVGDRWEILNALRGAVRASYRGVRDKGP